jgi:hypothetical protein
VVLREVDVADPPFVKLGVRRFDELMLLVVFLESLSHSFEGFLGGVAGFCCFVHLLHPSGSVGWQGVGRLRDGLSVQLRQKREQKQEREQGRELELELERRQGASCARGRGWFHAGKVSEVGFDRGAALWMGTKKPTGIAMGLFVFSGIRVG